MMHHRATADETFRDHAAYLADSYAGSVQSRTFIDLRTLLRGAQRALLARGQLTPTRSPRSPAPRRSRPTCSSWRHIATSSSTASRPSRPRAATRPMPSSPPRCVVALASRVAMEATYFGTVIARGTDTSIAFVERERGGTRWVGPRGPAPPLSRARCSRPPSRRRSTPSATARLAAHGADRQQLSSPIAVRVLGDHGEVLLESGNVSNGHWRSERPVLGPLMARVTYAILPSAVPVLMPGGYPPLPGPARRDRGRAGPAAGERRRRHGVARRGAQSTARGVHVQHVARVAHAARPTSSSSPRHCCWSAPAARRRNAAPSTRSSARHVTSARWSRTCWRCRAWGARPIDSRRVRRMSIAWCAKSPRSSNPSRGPIGSCSTRPSPPGPMATLDGDAVRRILINLLDNAIRHGGSGGTVRR